MDYGLHNVQFCYFGTVCRKIYNLVSRVNRLLDVSDKIPGRGKNLLYRNARGQAHGPFQPSVLWVPVSSFPVVKRSGRETDKALTCSVEVKNA
jgi:hypothetical protein